MSIYDDGPLVGYPETYGEFYGEGGGIVGLVLGVTAELYTGVWTDITDYIYQRQPATIQLGRQDESSQVSPASCAMLLNNRDGRFTTRNPVGALYGTIGQNTPFRLSVPAYLAGLGTTLLFADDTQSYASCPDSTALQLGELDARIDMWLDDYQPCTLAGKWGASGTDFAWVLLLNGDGTISLTWYDGADENTATSTQPLPYLGRVMVRATLAIAGAALVTFYTAPDMGGTQTQLGDVVTVAGAGAAQNAAGQPVQAGFVNNFFGATGGPLGKVYQFQLYNASATLVADPLFSAQAAGASSFTDGQGNTWTMDGTASLDNRCYRFHGEMSAWPKAADPSSRDAYSQATASGVLRRLQQGTTPVLSVMRRGITSTIASVYGVAAYWPAEDSAGSQQIASGLPGGRPMHFAGIPDFQGQAGSPSADGVFACSTQLPNPGTSAWQGSVSGSSANWGTHFLLSIPSGGMSNVPALAVINYTSGLSLTVGYTTAAGGTLTLTLTGFAATTCTEGVNGQGLLVQVQSSTTEQFLNTLAVGAPSAVSTGQSASMSGNVASVFINPDAASLSSAEIGHIWVSPNPPGLTFLSDYLNAWSGETAGNRVARLASENGLASRIYGFPDLTVTMGVQAIDTLANLLQDVEQTDMGLLYEPREAVGIGYRTSRSMCNQSAAATADYSMQQVSQGFADTADDLLTLNDVIVSNADGSSIEVSLTVGAMSTANPPSGIGPVGNSVDVYPQYDSQLNHLAGWLLHVRSVDEDRYPSIPFQMARISTPQNVLLLRHGDYLAIENTPYWIPPGPVKQLCAGFEETFGPGIVWPVMVNGVPESPYEVISLGTSVLESSGTVLATGYSSTAASFSVDVTGPLWVTGAVSIFAKVGGEEIEITNISGTSSPQTFTVTRSVNGVVKAQASGAAVTLASEPVLALV